jgi:hypothetical protein
MQGRWSSEEEQEAALTLTRSLLVSACTAMLATSGGISCASTDAPSSHPTLAINANATPAHWGQPVCVSFVSALIGDHVASVLLGCRSWQDVYDCASDLRIDGDTESELATSAAAAWLLTAVHSSFCQHTQWAYGRPRPFLRALASIGSAVHARDLMGSAMLREVQMPASHTVSCLMLDLIIISAVAQRPGSGTLCSLMETSGAAEHSHSTCPSSYASDAKDNTLLLSLEAEVCLHWHCCCISRCKWQISELA